MRTLRTLATIGLAALLLGVARPPMLRPYEVMLYGTIRAIDQAHRMVVIAYAPLDTAPGGIRRMRVRPGARLRFLLPGDPVQAIADTRRSPWVVRDVQRMP